MFALTHIYAARKINLRADDLFLYGAVFPDVPVTKVIDWDLMKTKTVEFSEYVKKNSKDLNSFADGLLVHENPYGIDRFVHGKNMDGYAFEKGKHILKNVADLFIGGNQISKVIKGRIVHEKLMYGAHSFIEFSVEMQMAIKYPNLAVEMKKVKNQGIKIEDELSKLFADFFGLTYEKSLNGIKEYNNFLVYDISSKPKAVEFFVNTIKITRSLDVSNQQVEKILDQSLNETADYLKFLNKIIKKCKEEYI